MSLNTHDLTIIGSGPAGYTAAIYAARANLSTLVLQGYESGGQLMVTGEVENYPGFAEGITGPELMENMMQQATRFGAEMLQEDAISVDIQGSEFHIQTSIQILTTKAIIIATGARAKWLGVPGEEVLRGHGVSACATCDGFFFKGKRLAVIGGGDTAVEEALFLTRFATHVQLIHRRGELRASKIMQKRAEDHPLIDCTWHTQVLNILGETSVSGLLLEDTQTKKVSELPVDGVFVAIGHQPNTSIFQGVLDMDTQGYIIPSVYSMTSIPGIFAAGDAVDRRYRQAVTAAADGCRAAIDAEHWLADQAI